MVATPSTALEIHNAHLPPGVSRPVEKLETFEGIRPARPPSARAADIVRRIQHPIGRAGGRVDRDLGIEPP